MLRNSVDRNRNWAMRSWSSTSSAQLPTLAIQSSRDVISDIFRVITALQFRTHKGYVYPKLETTGLAATYQYNERWHQRHSRFIINYITGSESSTEMKHIILVYKVTRGCRLWIGQQKNGKQRITAIQNSNWMKQNNATKNAGKQGQFHHININNQSMHYAAITSVK